MKAKPLSELSIRNLICSYLSYRKILIFIHDSVGIYDEKKKMFRKNSSPYRKKGVSDLLGIYRGKFLAIEVKSAKGKPTPEQLAFLKEVRLSGGIAFLARSIVDVKYELEKADSDLFGDGPKTNVNAPGSKTEAQVTSCLVLDASRRSGAI